MFVKLKTINIIGVEVQDIDVEVHMSNGNPGLVIVGLADKAISESKDRIRSAIISLGMGLPAKRITINLSPSSVTKEGSYYDLPIIVGILTAMNVFKEEDLRKYYILGEIGLDGSIRKTNGVLVAAMHAAVKGMDIICPFENGNEATWAGDQVEIIAPKNIIELINHIKGRQILKRPEGSSVKRNEMLNISDVKGQAKAKRAMEIAAAGGHNIMLIGSQGTGKSMLAKRMSTILPRMTSEEILELNMINSVAGILSEGQISLDRPFRSPHHSCSIASLIGGGRNPSPGEITLAHTGVLFLDELPEYQTAVIDSLRQPIEDYKISISRVGYKVTYPARFQLVCAMNPCKCGMYGTNSGCSKQPECAKAYQSKLSGPFLDRIDIKIEMSNQQFDKDMHNKIEESSDVVQQRVQKARDIQTARYKEYEGVYTNSQATDTIIMKYCMPKEKQDIDLLEEIYTRLNLSMRSYYKILKVARTIADLSGKEHVSRKEIIESCSYRSDALLVK